MTQVMEVDVLLLLILKWKFIAVFPTMLRYCNAHIACASAANATVETDIQQFTLLEMILKLEIYYSNSKTSKCTLINYHLNEVCNLYQKKKIIIEFSKALLFAKYTNCK